MYFIIIIIYAQAWLIIYWNWILIVLRIALLKTFIHCLVPCEVLWRVI